MGYLSLGAKVLKYFFTGQVAGIDDIRHSYDHVSSSYDFAFSSTMSKYNIEMLEHLAIPEHASVLDLACGTGLNAQWILSEHPEANVTGVDISSGMLKQAALKLGDRINFLQSSMLEFLGNSQDECWDIIVCGWALKYEDPSVILSHCRRLLKPGGQVGIIVNTAATLPEVRSIFTKLLAKHSDSVNTLMLELPNPQDKKELSSWFRRAGLYPRSVQEGDHTFFFPSTREAVNFVLSTGALAGYDAMLNVKNEAVKADMVYRMEECGLSTITHRFVWGVAEKCC